MKLLPVLIIGGVVLALIKSQDKTTATATKQITAGKSKAQNALPIVITDLTPYFGDGGVGGDNGRQGGGGLIEIPNDLQPGQLYPTWSASGFPEVPGLIY